MKSLRKTLCVVMPTVFLSALCFVSCKPEEPQEEIWIKGRWVHHECWLLEDCTVWIFDHELTFFDNTFTYFKDTVGYAEDTTGVYAKDIVRSGITKTGACWYKNKGKDAYFTYSDHPEDIYSAGAISDSSIFMHNSPINAFVQMATGKIFYRVNPPLPD